MIHILCAKATDISGQELVVMALYPARVNLPLHKREEIWGESYLTKFVYMDNVTVSVS